MREFPCQQASKTLVVPLAGLGLLCSRPRRTHQSAFSSTLLFSFLLMFCSKTNLAHTVTRLPHDVSICFNSSNYAIFLSDTWDSIAKKKRYQQSVARCTTSINLWCIDSRRPSHTLLSFHLPLQLHKSLVPYFQATNSSAYSYNYWNAFIMGSDSLYRRDFGLPGGFLWMLDHGSPNLMLCRNRLAQTSVWHS